MMDWNVTCEEIYWDEAEMAEIMAEVNEEA